MSQIKQIYLAGGMTGLTPNEYMDWRLIIANKLPYIAEQRNAKFEPYIINPAAYYNDDSPDDFNSQREVMEFDLHKLRQSDLVICNFNSPHSLGTMAELAIAWDRRIPIIGLNLDNIALHPWQTDMVNKMFDNLGVMLSYIATYYLV